MKRWVCRPSPSPPRSPRRCSPPAAPRPAADRARRGHDAPASVATPPPGLHLGCAASRRGTASSAAAPTGFLGLRIFPPGGVRATRTRVVRKMRSGAWTAAPDRRRALEDPPPGAGLPDAGMFESAAADSHHRSRTGRVDRLHRRLPVHGLGRRRHEPRGSSRAGPTPADARTLHPYVWRDDLVMPAVGRQGGNARRSAADPRGAHGPSDQPDRTRSTPRRGGDLAPVVAARRPT